MNVIFFSLFLSFDIFLSKGCWCDTHIGADQGVLCKRCTNEKFYSLIDLP
jgi:hypothetical protein